MAFTASQIAFAFKQAGTGTRVAEVCRKMGISEATFYKWKKKYGGLGVPELRRLRQLEEENSRLKQIVADLTLDKQMLQDILKKPLKVRQLRDLAITLIGDYRIISVLAGLLHNLPASLGVVLQSAPKGGSAIKTKDQGDCSNESTLWDVAHLHPAAQGGLSRQS